MNAAPIRNVAPTLPASSAPAPTFGEQLRAMSPEALAGARDAGLERISADCRGKSLPGFRCVPGTNHLGQVGHFWTVI